MQPDGITKHNPLSRPQREQIAAFAALFRGRDDVRGHWMGEKLCQECYVFGPDHNPMTLPPWSPDS
jgi:hypothetical protein